MPRLATLQSGLARLRRYRSSVRNGSALAVLACVALWVLLGAFVLDVLLHMGIIERVIVLLFFVGAIIHTARKYVAPALRVNEDAVQLALMVERQQGIGSDLVAAIQFADTSSPQYGSADLREAVISCTDEVSGNLNYLEGFSRQQLFNRAMLLGATLLLVAIPVIVLPAHVAAFLNRFTLGSATYPTRTQIAAIESPGERAPYGQPIVFKVRATGQYKKAEGRVEIRAKASGLSTTLELVPDPDQPDLFIAELPRALDDIIYRVFLDDAVGDEKTVTLIPLPVVDVDLTIETPEYARRRFQAPGEGRQRVALEGSRVVPIVKADKDLKAATFTVDGKPFPMRKDGRKDGKRFVLDSADNPFALVSKDLRYEVQVTDSDGLGLERPLSGVLQVRADQPPRIAAATVTRYVLAEAAPQIKYRATDDYALAKILVRKSVVRASSGMVDPTGQSDGGASGGTSEAQEIVETLHDLKGNTEKDGGTINIELSDLKLVIGDRLEITFEAVDFRGDQPGKTARSERMVFQVTDRKGVLDALREWDDAMDKKLDQIIDAQLGGSGSQ
ncbi:MAG: hypothetical protein WD768_22880 [Phycisphaeraceae bacterium]